MAPAADDIQLYRKMLKLDPESRVFELLAEELCAAGLWDEAADVCKRGLRYRPDHLRAKVLLGLALMEMGEAEGSEKLLMQVLEEFNKNSVIFKLLSEFAVFSGDAGKADAFARIYDAFQAARTDSWAALPAGAVSEEAFGAGGKEGAEEIEAIGVEPDIESLLKQGPALEQEAAASGTETAVQAEPRPGDIPSPARQLEDILSGLAERMERRFPVRETPPAILSRADRDCLRQIILSELSAKSPH